MFEPLGRAIAGYLLKPIGVPGGSSTDARLIAEVLRPGDVLLVEGNTRMSAAIKYLTQSMWSHAALYVGPRPEMPPIHGEAATLIEADVLEGVRAVPLSFYLHFRVRICRPVNLTRRDRERLVQFVLQRLGHRYDLQNVLDLLRYLLPFPLPARMRRRMIACGSGDPTRAICSTLIAQAFGAVGYPILPIITRKHDGNPGRAAQVRELWRIRHHSLYMPRDFDISPFFEVVKPRIARRFDYRSAPWSKTDTLVAIVDESKPPKFGVRLPMETA
ncbi:MAG TPA: YiiX/YebB-like N1pC/P60 family cysteine hydrolase [Burkholderiaceae bacterium]|nr:YiiX/YebB-like N1pC/P60 family cysteine hydrolase [Burkholderiaceae bacterium]